MSITQVNGFQCKNCTDIDYAKKHIDPAQPKDGPYGVNAKNDPPLPDRAGAVSFGGRLSGLNAPSPPAPVQAVAGLTGVRLDIAV